MISENDFGVKAVESMVQRASCRAFAERDIEEEKLDLIMEAGLSAASGGNLQPVSIIMVKDRENARRLCELCENQSFIAQAPVNLIFLLDWYKFSVYAADQKAPFTCPDSYMHFLIGVEDVMCIAQSIETAAHLLGLGSCYVGSCIESCDKLAKDYNLPKYSFPILVLSLGYPKAVPPKRKKLSLDVMVFEERYPDVSKEFIIERFNDKYAGMKMSLPKDETRRAETLAEFREALLTTYSPEETETLISQAIKADFINETQRRFGMQYHAKDMRTAGQDVIRKMEAQGLRPFRL